MSKDKQAQLKAAQAKKQAMAKRQAMAKAAQAKSGKALAAGKSAAAAAAAPAKKAGGTGLAKRGILRYDIEDEKELYASYMPFVKECGIFVPTPDGHDHKIGDEAFLMLSLPDGKGKFNASAKVVWINPAKKLGRRLPGVGLQIDMKNASKMREAIEEILDKKIKSPIPTTTM